MIDERYYWIIGRLNLTGTIETLSSRRVWERHVIYSSMQKHRSTIHRSITLAFLNTIVPMVGYTVQYSKKISDLQFRVLVMGRANSGKTSILQRVCDTTESPTIYRRGPYYYVTGRMEEVRGPHFVCESLSLPTSSNLNQRWMLVILIRLFSSFTH